MPIVSAVGTSVNVQGNPALGEFLQAAVVEAVVAAQAEGVTDPEIMKARKAAALTAARADWDAKIAAALNPPVTAIEPEHPAVEPETEQPSAPEAGADDQGA